MKIGILLAGHAPDAMRAQLGEYDGMFRDLLAGHDFSFQTWSVVDMDFPGSIDDADGWLITGSRHGAYEDLPFIAPLEQMIRDVDAARKPLIGVCFGHQIIAQALGGKVVKYPGGWSAGLTTYQGSDGPVALNAWHQDQVVERPARAKKIAESDFCENAILAYDDHIWTVQAHPEYDGVVIRGLAETRGKGVLPDDILSAAVASSSSDGDRLSVGAEMAAFFLRARAEATA